MNEDARESLHRFAMAGDRLAAAVCQATGLNGTELEALEHLEQDGPLTQRQLADRLLLTSGGTTLLVDRLERGGFVTRRPHPDDRRAVLLELNPSAGGPASEALERYHRTVTSAARRLSAAERDAVCGFLDAAAAAAQETAAALQTGQRRRADRRERRSRAASGAR